MNTIPHTTLGGLIDRFEVVLFDSFGVLAGSDYVVPGAVEAIERLNALNKAYLVLTNDASALPETHAARYGGMGLDIDAARIITAGSMLTAHFADLGLDGSRCVVLGTEDSARYVRAAGGEVTPFEDDFDVLVIGNQRGFPFLEATRAVLSTLFRKIDRGEKPHLVAPNPDLIFPDGKGFAFASGSLARMFESALALRTRLGKPHPGMFEEAARRSGSRDMVMIGDTPDTDARGANDFGIASVLVETGVATTDLSTLSEPDRPDYRMRSLSL